MVLHGEKKSRVGKSKNRLLVNITVLGSAGPIRFVVNENDRVAAVIANTLSRYAREGRLPILGSDLNNFVLYCPLGGTEALNPSETIGSVGMRNFTLCKKPQTDNADVVENKRATARKGNGSLKSWFSKSLKLLVSSH
ncbi:hypothetical protein NMG60_11023667 [Bertholletia excelsa]